MENAWDCVGGGPLGVETLIDRLENKLWLCKDFPNVDGNLTSEMQGSMKGMSGGTAGSKRTAVLRLERWKGYLTVVEQSNRVNELGQAFTLRDLRQIVLVSISPQDSKRRSGEREREKGRLDRGNIL